jgi:hypothetical protein
MGLFSSNKKTAGKQVVTDGKAGKVQAKPAVNQPGDRYEQEADAMAEKVVAAENDHQKATAVPATGLIGKHVMRKAEGSNGHAPLSDSFMTGLDTITGGSPLPESTKQTMEQAFGADFSDVRIFSNEKAAALSKSIQAKAFTYQNKIFFNKGQFTTDTIEGRKLLAHELTHVLQQKSGLQLIQRDDLVLPPVITFRQVWAQFEQARWHFHTTEALELAVQLAGMHMEMNDVNEFGLELAVFLMQNGHMTEGLQVLQNCEGFYWVRYASLRPSPHQFMESYYVDQLREQGIQAIQRQDFTTAFQILGFIVLYDQMEVSFANSRSQPGDDTELQRHVQNISPSLTPRERHREMEEIFQLGQLGASIGRIFAYANMGSAYTALRQDLTIFLRLQREAILAGNATEATSMGNQHTNFMSFLRSQTWLMSGDVITMHSAESFNEQGDVGYIIYGNNDQQEVVTPLPGTATPSQLGFFPAYRPDLERVVSDMEGQAQLLNDLLAIPAIRRAFPTGVIDMTSLNTRIRIWQMVFTHHATGSSSATALESTIRTIERYLRHFTVHTEYNIRDFGRSYLDTNFPTDLIGRSVRDCGVYALTTAYEVFRMGRAASPRLNLQFKLVSMPEHVTLLILDNTNNNHYLVNNDAIAGPNTGDWMHTVAQAYSAVFSRGFGITPSIAIDLGSTADTDSRFRGEAWDRYRASASWGFQAEPLTGPGDTRTIDERSRDSYVHYYQRVRDFDLGCQRLVAVMDTLTASVQAAASGNRQSVLNSGLNDPALTTAVNALGVIYRFYGPQAAASGVIAVDALAPASVRGHIVGRPSMYLYSMPGGTTVHPLVRYCMAVLLLESLGTPRTADQNTLITAIMATPDFNTQLTTYTTNQFPVQFKKTHNAGSDVYEQEADAMAEKLGAGEVAKKVTRVSGNQSGEYSRSVGNSLQSAGGNRLDTATRFKMENFFNADFSGVKVHAGAEATGLNQQLNAKAFTTGKNIYFNSGEYNPHSNTGEKLLAHELTHVLQQESSPGIIQRKPNDKTYYEKEGLQSVEIWMETIWKAVDGGRKADGKIKITTEQSVKEIEGATFFSGMVEIDLKDGDSFQVQVYEDNNRSFFYTDPQNTLDSGYYFNFDAKEPDDNRYIVELKNHYRKKFTGTGEKGFIIYHELPHKTDDKKEEEKEAPPPKPAPPKTAPTNWGGISTWFRDVQQLVKGNGRTANNYEGKFKDTQFTLPENSVPDELQFIKDKDDREIIQVREHGYPSWILATEFKEYKDDTKKEAAADFYYERIISVTKSLAKRKPDDPEGKTVTNDNENLTSTLESKDGKPTTYKLPALPAEIVGEDQQPVNGTGVLAMKIKWEHVSHNELDRMTEAMAKKDYRWELWDITDLYERQKATEEKEKQKALDEKQSEIENGPLASDGNKGQVSDTMDHVGGDFNRATNELKQRAKDIDADEQKAIDEGRYLDAVSNELNKELFGLDTLFTYGKVALGAGADFVGDDDERSVYWTKKGVYIARCIARIKNDKEEVLRVPSVATKIIKVQDTAEISLEALNRPRKQLDDLTFRLLFLQSQPKDQTDPEQIKLLQEKVESLEHYVGGNYEELLKANKKKLQEKKAQVEKEDAYMLQFDIGKGRIWELENQIEQVDKQLAHLAERQKGKTLYSAEAVLVSSVTGQQYPLMIQITEPVSKAMKYYCYLSDITTDKGGKYEAYASSENDALNDVLTNFSSELAAQYGGGVLSIRLPNKGWYKDLSDTERVKQLEIRTHDWATAKMNLERLATVIAMLGLVVTDPALIVVGVALTAGLAADRIAKRISDGTFSWDSQIIGDMLQILLAATGFLGKTAGQIQAIGNKLKYFQKYGKFFLLTEAQLGKIKNIATASEEVLNALSEVHGDLDILDNFAKIQHEVNLGNKTHTDARKEMAGLMSSVMQNLAGKLKQHYSAGTHMNSSAGEENTNPAKKQGPYSDTAFKALHDVLVNAEGLQYVPEIVHNEELGNGAKAKYRDNMLVLEVGSNVSPEIVAGHIKTLAALQKYEGVLGSVRKMIDYVSYLVTGKGPGKYGSEHFVAHNEIGKLQEMIGALRSLKTRMETGITDAANNPDLEKINKDITAYESQIAEHAKKLGSLASAKEMAIASGNTMGKGSSIANPLKKSDAQFYTDPRIGETRYFEDEAGRLSRTTRVSENVFELEAMLHPDQGIRDDYQKYYSSKGLQEPGMELAHGLGPITGVESPQAIANAAILVNQRVQKMILEGRIDTLRKHQAPDAQMRVVIRIERVDINGKPYLKSVKYEVLASKPGVPEATILHAEVTIKNPDNKNPDPSEIDINIRATEHPDQFLDDSAATSSTAKPAKSRSGKKDVLKPDMAREYVAHMEMLIQDLKNITGSSHKRSVALFRAQMLLDDLKSLHQTDRNKQINNLTRDKILNFNEGIADIFYDLPELKQLKNRDYPKYFNSKNIRNFIE